MLEKECVARNIETFHQPLDDVEVEAQEYVIRHFSKLKKPHWEGVEVERYWNSLNTSS